MKKITILVISFLLLSLFLAACQPQGSTQAIDQAVMQTMIALNVEGTRSAEAVNAQMQATASQEALAPQTATLAPQPQFTATPEEIWLTIIENTNCRTGPASNYPLVTTLMKDQKVQAGGRSFKNDYHYITVPGEENLHCWVWDKYVSISGNSESLPIFTPLPTSTPSPTPTPVPGIELDYYNLTSCGSDFGINIIVKNTGQVVWSSVQVTIKDVTADKTFSYSTNNFTQYSGCTAGGSQADLFNQEEGFTSNMASGKFTYDPTGHKLNITVTVYEDDSLAGIAFSKSFTVTP